MNIPADTAAPASRIAPDTDWIATVRQALPSARRVLASLRPTWHVDGVHAIDAAFLRAAGIRALIWDVDGTLTYRHACAPAHESSAAFERLRAQPGLRHVLLSNCGEGRFGELAALFDPVPVVKGYRSDDGPVFRIRTGSADRWTRQTRGTLRPMRKPDPALVRFAMHVLGTSDGTAVAVVGDQYLTDVAAANLAGVRSIRVPTIGRATFPASVRALQTLDQWLYRLTA